VTYSLLPSPVDKVLCNHSDWPMVIIFVSTLYEVLERSPTLWIFLKSILVFPKMEMYFNNACTHKDWILSLIILYVPIWFIEIFSSHQETLPFLFWDKIWIQLTIIFRFFYRDAIWMEGFKSYLSIGFGNLILMAKMPEENVTRTQDRMNQSLSLSLPISSRRYTQVL